MAFQSVDTELSKIANSILDLSRVRQRGRIFNTLMSGLEVARAYGHSVREMVLTLKRGVSDFNLFAHWFQTLRKRIEHEFRFRLEYSMVMVNDGTRVHAHIMFKAVSLVSGALMGVKSSFIPRGWLVKAWHSITKHSSYVYIQVLKNNPQRLANYFVSQYFSNQEFKCRLSHSWNWVFRGFRRVWREAFSRRYFDAKRLGSCVLKDEVVRDWHTVLGMDKLKRLARFPFLKSGAIKGKEISSFQ